MQSNHKSRRLELIKRSVEFHQQALEMQLKNIQNSISKKEKSVQSLKSYIKQSEEQYCAKQISQSTHFINNQLFIDHLSKAMSQEEENLKTITNQKEKLYQDIKTNTHKIDTIETILNDINVKNSQHIDKMIEQIEHDQWVSQSGRKQTGLTKKTKVEV